MIPPGHTSSFVRVRLKLFVRKYACLCVATLSPKLHTKLNLLFRVDAFHSKDDFYQKQIFKCLDLRIQNLANPLVAQALTLGIIKILKEEVIFFRCLDMQ